MEVTSWFSGVANRMRPRANQKINGWVLCGALRSVAFRTFDCVTKVSQCSIVRNLPVDSASGQRNKSLTISTDHPLLVVSG